MLTRRKVSVAIPAFVAAGALAACAGQTAAQVTQEVVTYGATIANGLANFVTAAQGIPSGTASTITGYAKDAVTVAQTLNTSMTQTAAQPVVTQIGTDVSNTANAVQGLVAANSNAANILADIQLAMPLFETAAGIATLVGAPLGSTAAMGRLQKLPKVTL